MTTPCADPFDLGSHLIYLGPWIDCCLRYAALLYQYFLPAIKNARGHTYAGSVNLSNNFLDGGGDNLKPIIGVF
jgi:hypothetical protein